MLRGSSKEVLTSYRSLSNHVTSGSGKCLLLIELPGDTQSCKSHPCSKALENLPSRRREVEKKEILVHTPGQTFHCSMAWTCLAHIYYRPRPCQPRATAGVDLPFFKSSFAKSSQRKLMWPHHLSNSDAPGNRHQPKNMLSILYIQRDYDAGTTVYFLFAEHSICPLYEH